MKYRINITINEEANNKLNLQENKSKYIEDLILDNKTTRAAGVDLVSIEAMLDERFEHLVGIIEDRFQRSQVGTQGELEPKEPVPVMGYACCLNDKKPCKHWQWDGVKQSYTNTITGEVREIYL